MLHELQMHYWHLSPTENEENGRKIWKLKTEKSEKSPIDILRQAVLLKWPTHVHKNTSFIFGKKLILPFWMKSLGNAESYKEGKKVHVLN